MTLEMYYEVVEHRRDNCSRCSRVNCALRSGTLMVEGQSEDFAFLWLMQCYAKEVDFEKN